MDCDRRAGVEQVEQEVAIGDGVEGVEGEAPEAEGAGDSRSVDRERAAGERSRAEWHLSRGVMGGLDADAVPQQRLGVGEKYVPGSYGLPALKVRVAGHGIGRVGTGLRRQRLDDLTEQACQRRGGRPCVKPEVEGDLVVARAAGMEAAAQFRFQFRQPPLHRGVDVLVRLGEFELAALQLAADANERALDPFELRIGEEASDAEPLGMRD